MTNGNDTPRPLPQPTRLSGPFWDAAREHRLVVQYDPEAGAWQFYPRAISVHTSRQNLEWREVSGAGTLYSWTLTVVPPPGFRDRAPYLIGVVELDEGVRMMAPLSGLEAAQVKIGMRLRVCWQDLSDDITYFAFEPVG